MQGITGKILGVFLCFVMMILMLASAATSERLQAQRSIIAEVTNFVDEVTDTGSLTDRQIQDLYLGCASYGPMVDVTINRYARVWNPDPTSPGDAYVTYTIKEDITTLNQGDIIQVQVEELGVTGTASVLYAICGFSISQVDFTLAGRIR